MRTINKLNKAELSIRLCNPSGFETAEDHMTAFKRFKNLRAK